MSPSTAHPRSPSPRSPSPLTGSAGSPSARRPRQRLTARALFAVAALTVAGSQGACRSTPSSFPVQGQRAELASLVGEWVGEYAGAESGRSGSIVFRLRADADSASGDVVMVPRTAAVVTAPEAPTVAPGDRPAAQPLTIRFVRLENGAVSGTLTPYRDPESGALLSTVFTGRVDGDQIRGTFTTTGGDLPSPQHGEWHATRRPPR